MAYWVKNGATSNVLRVEILDSTSTTGDGKTGLTSASAGLIISTIADNEASSTTYTQAGSTIETIATLGTFATPTATKCRFKEVDSTNHPGLYEIQLADARFAVSSAKSLIITLSGVTGMVQTRLLVQLTVVDPNSAGFGLTNASANVVQWNGTNVATPSTAGVAEVNVKNFGNTAVTGRDIGASVLLSAGTGTGQLDFTSGVVKANATQWLGGAIPAVNVTGVPLVDAKYLLGTIFSTPATAGIMDVNLKNIANAAVSTSSAQIGVNVVNFGGSVVTGRDIGASVLLSAGTGTGQLDFTSGVVKSNLAQILGTALTETAGQLAGGFKQWFNVATPTGTVNSIPNAAAGAAGGLFIAGSNAATTVNFTGNLSGSVGSVTAGVTVTTNNDKTGYSLSQAFPTNFSSLSIDVSGRVDMGKILGTASAGVPGYMGIDWSHVNAPTTAVGLSGTTISTVQSIASVSGAVNSVTSGVTLAAGAINAAAVASDTDVYQAKVTLQDDNAGGNDRYVVVFFKNSEPIVAGITLPTIQVIKVSDGTDLIASTSLTQVASTGIYKHDEGTNRVTNGATYVVKIGATINSLSRSWYQPVGRDS